MNQRLVWGWGGVDHVPVGLNKKVQTDSGTLPGHRRGNGPLPGHYWGARLPLSNFCVNLSYYASSEVEENEA